jgi:phage portal protein BeeE
MSLVPWRRRQVDEVRESYPLSLQEWAAYQNVFYPLNSYQTISSGDTEAITNNFKGLIQQAYQSNGIVFACMLTRMLHFQQARFQYQRIRNGTPGDLFGTADLQILETPWPNATTLDLLARMIQDVDLAGNFYAVRQGDRLVRLRPDWTYIVLGSRTRSSDWEADDPDTDLVGYQYHPGGLYSGRGSYLYLPEEVAHWAPIPDPLAWYRGESWLMAVIREIQADGSMTAHRQKFFDHGATVNSVVEVPVAADQETFKAWVKALRDGHEGGANAYRMMFLGAGAKYTPIGSDMQQIDFKVVQGAGEVRIATAARIPPTILGISEGLQGSTLNAGNYQSARRNFADGLLRPYWAGAAGALASIVPKQGGARLWYDDSQIAFLKEDVKDAADILNVDAQTIHTLISAGYEPDSVIAAVVAQDFTLLAHTGLYSVQLQPAGTITQGKGAVVQGTPVPAASGTQ